MIERVTDNTPLTPFASSGILLKEASYSTDVLAVVMALLLGEPDREIFERMGNKYIYVAAMAIYLHEMGYHDILDKFLDDEEVVSYISESIWAKLFEDNKVLKDKILTRYIGVTTEDELKTYCDQKLLIGSPLQRCLIRAIMPDPFEKYYTTGREFEDDPELTFINLYGRLERLLQEQVNKMTPPNIKALREGDWFCPTFYGRKMLLSEASEMAEVEDDIEITLTYSVEINKSKDSIGLFPSADVMYSIDPSIDKIARYRKICVYKKYIESIIKQHGKYTDIVLMDGMICIKPELHTIIPYKRSSTW